MGAVVSFENIDDGWVYRAVFFEVLLDHAVIRNSSRDKLPMLYPDVEREISQHLHEVDPVNYPDEGGSLGLIVFTDYPIEERREFLAAMKRGVEEIRNMPRDGDFDWNFDSKHKFVLLGEELIDLMERSLETSAQKTPEQSADPAPG